MVEDVLLVDRGPITTLTLNRPEKLNALNRDLGMRFINTITEVGFDPAVRVIVIRGAGRSFCAGDEIGGSSLPSAISESYDRSDPVSAGRLGHYWGLQRAIRKVPRPVIVAAHGHCMGAGMDMMLSADYAIAAETAVFAVIFIKRAIAAGTVMLPRYVGMKRATQMLFEGETISAEQAFELGLVTRVVPDAELDSAVQAQAEKLAAGPTRVLGFMKHGLNRAYFPGLEDELQDMAFLQSFGRETADSAEARAAWRERRKPAFVGR